jgi:hypothetical protein
MHCVIAFVKDESNNLMFMGTNLYFVIDCYPLRLSQVYEGTCFGHIMVKVANMLEMMKK